MKNIIFQYMITNGLDKRRSPKGWTGSRDELYKKSSILSWDSFNKYAKAVGATHHFTKSRVFTSGCGHDTHLYLFEVLRIIYDELFDDFDNVLYVDSDVICNTRENIFNLVDGTFEMAGIYESDIMTGRGICGYNSWDKRPDKRDALKRKLDRVKIPMIPTSPPARPSCFGMFNTGVMLWTKEGRHKAREKFDDWFEFYKDGVDHADPFWLNNDQPFISGQIAKHGIKTRLLDQKWNDSPSHYDFYEQWENQNFLHYTGGFGKVDMLDHYSVNLFKYI